MNAEKRGSEKSKIMRPVNKSLPGRFGRQRFLPAARLAPAFVAVLVISSFALPNPSAHKYYTSLCRVQYNRETKSLEVTARVFSDDLEVALTRRNHKAVYLDKKDAGPLVAAYLQDTFELKGRDGKLRRISWVGMEVKVDSAWLYFEIKMPEGLEGAELRNRILFELFSEQVNIVNIQDGDSKSDLVFKQGDEFKALLPSK